jgi:acyl-CoA hydrolase
VTLDFPGGNFLTVGMDRVEFKKSIRQGAILRFCVERARTGRTSAHYLVRAYVGSDPGPVFSTRITFVCVDGEGAKRPLPGPPAGGRDGDCAPPDVVL